MDPNAVRHTFVNLLTYICTYVHSKVLKEAATPLHCATQGTNVKCLRQGNIELFSSKTGKIRYSNKGVSLSTQPTFYLLPCQQLGFLANLPYHCHRISDFANVAPG